MQHRGIDWGMCACIALLAVTWTLDTPAPSRFLQNASAAVPEQARAPLRTSAEELHQHGGIPPGWQFSLPAGNPVAGRAVFEKLECYQCHEVQGGNFPEPSPAETRPGPELTGVGDHHPIGYLAESILYPNAVIVTGPGHTGDDGLSIMPDFRDSLRVAELLDLVAYLKSLEGDDGHEEAEDHAHHAAPQPLFEQVLGDFRVRLDYMASDTAGHTHKGIEHGKPAKSGAPAKATSHLMASVTDAKTGLSVPYLPVSATITRGKTPPLQVKLQPMLGDSGLHYGADVTLPSSPAKITLSIGTPTIRVISPAAGRFSSAQKATVDWNPQSPAPAGKDSQSPPPQWQNKPTQRPGH